ncbi:hypothetical protein HPB47_014228 [Ixodes persulcatus]|uniref:Uncharacterized protein n=1 Tax=Ixodes persulcatus TaxID=34615 RepID=A0AC60QXM1_IXOPE|nr:hypothetical protein HPB47_014228 [Ixodes persulcatus]
MRDAAITLVHRTQGAVHEIARPQRGCGACRRTRVSLMHRGSGGVAKLAEDAAGEVRTLIERCHSVGLQVVAITSDIGSGNRAMWKQFGVHAGKYSKTVNLIPHPQKNLTFKLAPKLRPELLDPNHFETMKVSTALWVLSHSTATALRFLVENHGWSTNFLTTAWFLEQYLKASKAGSYELDDASFYLADLADLDVQPAVPTDTFLEEVELTMSQPEENGFDYYCGHVDLMRDHGDDRTTPPGRTDRRKHGGAWPAAWTSGQLNAGRRLAIDSIPRTDECWGGINEGSAGPVHLRREFLHRGTPPYAALVSGFHFRFPRQCTGGAVLSGVGSPGQGKAGAIVVGAGEDPEDVLEALLEEREVEAGVYVRDSSSPRDIACLLEMRDKEPRLSRGANVLQFWERRERHPELYALAQVALGVIATQVGKSSKALGVGLSQPKVSDVPSSESAWVLRLLKDFPGVISGSENTEQH